MRSPARPGNTDSSQSFNGAGDLLDREVDFCCGCESTEAESEACPGELSERPIASNTWLGSGLVDEHAEPELTAISRIAIMSASPSTPLETQIEVSCQPRFRMPVKTNVAHAGRDAREKPLA